MAGILTAPLALERINSRQSTRSRYTDPWTEPLDGEFSSESEEEGEYDDDDDAADDAADADERGLPPHQHRRHRSGSGSGRPAMDRRWRSEPTATGAGAASTRQAGQAPTHAGHGHSQRRSGGHEFLHPHYSHAHGAHGHAHAHTQHPHSASASVTGRRSFDSAVPPSGSTLGVPLHRPSTNQSTRSASAISTGAETGSGSGFGLGLGSGFGFGFGMGKRRGSRGSVTREREERQGEVAIDMSPIGLGPGSPGSHVTGRSAGGERERDRELEQELGVEDDIPEDAGELGDADEGGNETETDTAGRREPEPESGGVLDRAAEAAVEEEREELGMEGDIARDESGEAGEVTPTAAAPAGGDDDDMATPRAPRGRRRGWSIGRRTGTTMTQATTFVSPERSPSPPPGHHRRRLFKYREHRRNMKLSRTYSTMSSFSLDAARKRGVSWAWKVWLAVFPPDVQDADFIPNYRYTPILSGIVVPFAILLEIPGLTEHWYIRTENNITVDYQPNPLILDIGLGISMTCAVIANLSLVARFLERRVWLTTIIATVALGCHDLINIVIVTIFGVIHRFNDGFTYGEAYWITVCSTIASTFVNCTLIYDLVKTKDFAHSGSGLTAKQRSLVIVVMLLICYIALGALINAFAMTLSFQDALYFTIVSIETIGFGDIYPTTVFAQIWTCCYVTFGILNLALAVGTTRETIIEAFENAYRIRRAEIHKRRKEHREAKKLRQAQEEKLRELGLMPKYVMMRTGRGGAVMRVVDPPATPHDGAVVQSPIGETPMTPNGFGNAAAHNGFGHRIGSAVSSFFPHSGGPKTGSTLVPPDTANGFADGHSPGLTSVPESSTAVASVPSTANETVKEETFLSPGDEARKLAADLRGDLLHLDHSIDREEESYIEFKKRIEKEEMREFYTKIAVAWALFFSFWMAGAAIFSKTEEWTFAGGMYFCFIAFSTIGYGDRAPASPAGRAIFTVWALAGVAAMTILISVVSEAYNSRYKTVVVRHGMLDRAVKHIHDQQAKEEANLRRHEFNTPTKSQSPRTSMDGTTSTAAKLTSVNKVIDKAQKELEALPADLLRQAKALHEHLNFLNKTHHGGEMPSTMQKMVDDIAEAEKLDTRMKNSLMEDDEARRTLFMMSYERTLNNLIHSAEKAVELLAQREKGNVALNRLHQLTLDERSTTLASSTQDNPAPELYRPPEIYRGAISGPMEPRPYDEANESMRQAGAVSFASGTDGNTRESLTEEGRRRARPKVRIDVSGLGAMT